MESKQQHSQHPQINRHSSVCSAVHLSFRLLLATAPYSWRSYTLPFLQFDKWILYVKGYPRHRDTKLRSPWFRELPKIILHCTLALLPRRSAICLCCLWHLPRFIFCSVTSLPVVLVWCLSRLSWQTLGKRVS